MSATVDIADAFRDAERVAAADVRVGDRLFDTTGGTHPVARVIRHPRRVELVRDDGWGVIMERGETITVLRAS